MENAFADSAPRWLSPRAAYIHIPFCAHHCGYCDFAVVAGKDHSIDDYLEGLAAELAQMGASQPVETLFIGGGTPTHLDPVRLARLLGTVRRWLPLESNAEFSIEANPATLTTEKVAALADHGVTRVSLGAQSFRPGVLRFLERDHDATDISRAVESVKARIPEVSLDLIFGVPGQSPADWQHDLGRAIALEPDHVSTYGLTFEKGTRLWKQRRQGLVQPLGEETERDMYGQALDTLAEAGFEHYEISNHARPGRQCRHNQVYWANEAYLGFGLGAARYVGGRREVNTRDMVRYLRLSRAGQCVTMQSETLSASERARETMAIQLRRSQGIERERFCYQTGFPLESVAGRALARHVALGVLEDDGARVRLTRAGKFVADTIIRDLL